MTNSLKTHCIKSSTLLFFGLSVYLSGCDDTGEKLGPGSDHALLAETGNSQGSSKTARNGPGDSLPDIEDLALVHMIWSLPDHLTVKFNSEIGDSRDPRQLDRDSFRSILESYWTLVENQQPLPPYGDYPGDLTHEEFVLCLGSPDKCSLTKETADHARLEANSRYPFEFYLGRGDAFRHAYWNALMTKEIDETWAEKFATAHESETPEGNDRTMDLRNNAEGRTVGRKGGSRAEIAARIQRKVQGGDLWCLRDSKLSGDLVRTGSGPC